MPREPDIWVVYNNVTEEIYVVKKGVKMRSLVNVLTRLYKVMCRKDKLQVFEMEVFFRNYPFSKDKIYLCWDHKASDIMVWNQKFFRIRDSVL